MIDGRKSIRYRKLKRMMMSDKKLLIDLYSAWLPMPDRFTVPVLVTENCVECGVSHCVQERALLVTGWRKPPPPPSPSLPSHAAMVPSK